MIGRGTLRLCLALAIALNIAIIAFNFTAGSPGMSGGNLAAIFMCAVALWLLATRQGAQ